MGLTKPQKIVLCVVILIFLIIGWGMFPLFFKWLMIELGSKGTKLEDFGPLGDIYGSLNTLFTSATLAFVIYATLLQRQANFDARKAMADQLQHAKDSTANQLQQVREATEQQILHSKQLADLQLAQAIKAASDQLELARITHKAQMKEIQRSNFDNKFYALLNYKLELLNNILAVNANNEEFKGVQVFDMIALFFIKQPLGSSDESIDLKELKSKYFSFLSELNNNNPLTSVYSYFLIYESLFMLIDSSENIEIDKNLYKHLIRNSMLAGEQIALFFIAPLYTEFLDLFANREMIHSFDICPYKKYALDFYDQSYFMDHRSKQLFEDNKKKTPA